jgi:hypothetical protein
MKNKIILITGLLLALAVPSQLKAQWTNLSIHLKDDLTGQADNMKFTKYPHSYPGDVIAGITVIETATPGYYVARGFTTLQYAKLYIVGTGFMASFDSVLTGNIVTYLQSNYGRLGTANTWTALNGFVDGNFSGTLNGLADVTLYTPYLNGTSTWLSDYGLLTNTSLLWKGYSDSIYGVKKWYLDGTKLRLLTSYKWYGVNSSNSPFEYNTSQFSWTSDKLNRADYPYDSLVASRFSLFRDTTIGEATYYKSWTLKRPYFNYIDSQSVYLYYKNEYGSSRDSMWVINKLYTLAKENANIELTTSLQTLNAGTLQLPHTGLWKVTAEIEYEFEFGTNIGGDIRDSIFCSILWSNAGDSSVVAIPCQDSTYCGEKGKMIITSVRKAASTEVFYLKGLASLDAQGVATPFKRKVLWIKVLAELVN